MNSTKKYSLMAKKVAGRWLESHIIPEYKLTIYVNSKDNGINVPALIRTAKKRKTRWSQNGPYPDFKIRASFDFVTVRSKDEKALLEIESFFKKMGYETFGVFGVE